MKLHYSEAFYSVQGEGKFVGVPKCILRTFGCNCCMNFGLDRSEPKCVMQNKNKVLYTIKKYKTY